MSGTQDNTSAVQNLGLNPEIAQDESRSGTDEKTGEAIPKEMTSSQKMDLLLRGRSPEVMKKEIEKLRKESAKHRTSTKEVTLAKAEIESKAAQIQQELDALKASHRSLSIMRKLDKAGCIKSDLVAKDVPADCEDIDKFVENYKNENAFLFKTQKQSLGGAFKPSITKNLTPSQQMDAYIRAALGR